MTDGTGSDAGDAGDADGLTPPEARDSPDSLDSPGRRRPDLPAPETVPPDADPPVRVAVHDDRPVVVDFDPGLTFHCVDNCTWCCHHGVLLYETDMVELARRANLSDATTDFRGERFVRQERKRHDHADEDGQACYFLTEEGLCELHAEHDWKPTRCSVFPLAVSVVDGDLRVDVRDSAREHCEGLSVGDRRVVENLEAFLPATLWDLPDPSTRREL